jgi:environmental stress-induced protein Ves
MQMPRVLSHLEFIDMPWKNGRGHTTEIFKIEANGLMVFRISSAEVSASGEFSDFSGYDRSLVNIGAGEMVLTHGETSVSSHGEPLLPLAVAHFDGGIRTYCRVSEATRDLNIFCAQNVYFASTVVRTLVAPEFLPVPVSSNTFIFVVDGSLVVQNNEKMQFFVQKGDALLHESEPCQQQDRWLLASASDLPCVIVTVVFRGIEA